VCVLLPSEIMVGNVAMHDLRLATDGIGVKADALVNSTVISY